MGVRMWMRRVAVEADGSGWRGGDARGDEAVWHRIPGVHADTQRAHAHAHTRARPGLADALIYRLARHTHTAPFPHPSTHTRTHARWRLSDDLSRYGCATLLLR